MKFCRAPPCSSHSTHSNTAYKAWISFRAGHRRYHASPAHLHLNDQVDSTSLEGTLNLHRARNRALLIKRVYTEDPRSSTVFRPNLPSQNVVEPRASEKSSPKVRIRHIFSKQQNAPQAGGARRTNNPTRRVDGLSHSGSQQSYRLILDHTKPKISWEVDVHDGQTVQYPWLDHINDTATDGDTRLNDEMKAFRSYMFQVPREEKAARRAKLDTAAVLDAGGIPRPILIGSRRTGMMVPHSDVDLLVLIRDPDRSGEDDDRGPSPTRPKMISSQLRQLTEAKALLQRNKSFSKVALLHTRVPVVTAIHLPSGLPVRIKCGVSIPSSLDFILGYQAEFPTIINLFIVLRMILETRNLFGPGSGSVSSYSLTMLIVAALKRGEGKYPRHNLGKQLLYFLEFYKDFDFSEYGISVEPTNIFLKRHVIALPEKWTSPFMRGQRSIAKRSMRFHPDHQALCLQDPSDYMNDLGTTCVAIDGLKILFGKLYDDISAAVLAWDGEWDRVGNQSASGRRPCDPSAKLIKDSGSRHDASILHFALGANYEGLENVRDRMIYGAEYETDNTFERETF